MRSVAGVKKTRVHKRMCNKDMVLTCRVVSVAFVSPLLKYILGNSEEYSDVKRVNHFL